MTTTRGLLFVGVGTLIVVAIATARSSQQRPLLVMIGAVMVLLLAGLGLVAVVGQVRLWWMRRDIRRLSETRPPDRKLQRPVTQRPRPPTR